MKSLTKIESLVDEVIEEFQFFDLDPGGVRRTHPETPTYLFAHRHEYVRTLRDVVNFAEQNSVDKILEIGAFFGLVCICLSKLGFRVCAADIPEYMSMPEQKQRFARYNIEIAEVRLQDYLLPFEDNRFDAVIMCEVLEHLNFNPLPLIKEINRIAATGSLFYLSLPNQAQIRHRLQLLCGRSILSSIQGYFDQLDPAELVIANGHWREYTAIEIRQMLERMGYEIHRHYFFCKAETLKEPTLRNKLSRLMYGLFSSFKENQTALAIKKRRPNVVFRIPKTVHPSLESL